MHLVQGYPEEECARLLKALLDMPINNSDNQNGRSPKEISRHLVPKYEDRGFCNSIEVAILRCAAVELPPRLSREEPQLAIGSSRRAFGNTIAKRRPVPENHTGVTDVVLGNDCRFQQHQS